MKGWSDDDGRIALARAPWARGGAAKALPEAPRHVRVGMPQLDAAGLSEGWLLRYAGDLQWEAIARQLGVASDEIRGAGGERLYPTVVAVRGRYPASLAAVRENHVLDTRVEVVPVGRACAWGRIAVSFDSRGAGGVLAAGERVLSLELLTTFAVRERAPGASNALKMMPPAPALAASWTSAVPAGSPPHIAQLARAARRGEPLDDDFSGPVLGGAGDRGAGAPPLGTIVYEPSPYVDYNGAGLLYFASYVTIADTAERQLVRRLGLLDTEADFSLATSPARRDVYYLENLPLGACLTAQLLGFDVTARTTTSHVRLVRTDDGRRMAEVITERRRLAADGRGPR